MYTKIIDSNIPCFIRSYLSSIEDKLIDTEHEMEKIEIVDY